MTHDVQLSVFLLQVLQGDVQRLQKLVVVLPKYPFGHTP